MSRERLENPFAEVLQRAAERLPLGEPARSRILLEMTADLEDSYQHFLERGLDEAEAARRAEEAFGASDDALKRLVVIHQPGFGDVAERFTRHLGGGWSRLLLVVFMLFGLGLAAQVLSDRSYFIQPSPFLVPIGALALAAFLLTVWKLVQIGSRTGERSRRLRRGLGGLLFCSAMTLGVSGLGFLYHLQRFFRLNADRAPESLIRNFAGWMISISSLMTTALVTAVLSALVWFVLSGLIARSEAREVDDLLRVAR